MIVKYKKEHLNSYYLSIESNLNNKKSYVGFSNLILLFTLLIDYKFYHKLINEEKRDSLNKIISNILANINKEKTLLTLEEIIKEKDYFNIKFLIDNFLIELNNFNEINNLGFVNFDLLEKKE